MAELLQYAEMMLVIVFVPIVFWLKSIAASMDEIKGQHASGGVDARLDKMCEQFSREHTEAQDRHTRDHGAIQEDLRGLGKDLQEKVSKVMNDHSAHEKQNVKLELMVQELVEHHRHEMYIGNKK